MCWYPMAMWSIKTIASPLCCSHSKISKCANCNALWIATLLGSCLPVVTIFSSSFSSNRATPYGPQKCGSHLAGSKQMQENSFKALLPFSGCPDTSMHFSRKLVSPYHCLNERSLPEGIFLSYSFRLLLHVSFIQLWIKTIIRNGREDSLPLPILASLLFSSDSLWPNRHNFARIIDSFFFVGLWCFPQALWSSYVSKILNLTLLTYLLTYIYIYLVCQTCTR